MLCCCVPETEVSAVIVDTNSRLTDEGADDTIAKVASARQEAEQKQVEQTGAADAPGQPAAEKVTAVEVPTASSSSTPVFECSLQRATMEAPWGLKLDFCEDSAIHICEVRHVSCPVSVYNARAPEGCDVRPGDYIMSVNGLSPTVGGNTTSGISWSDSLRAEMKGTSVTLSIKRPEIFSVDVSKAGDTMGLELNFTAKGTSLAIVRVGAGAVSRCSPSVTAGDRIIAVNGFEGFAEELLEAIKTSQDDLTLKISRHG